MMVRPLARRPEAWLRIGAVAAAAALLAVSVPLGATVYNGPLLVLFAGVLAHVAAIPLALVRPSIAAPLSVVGAVVVMAAAHGGTAPWPWSVTTMITQALVLALLGFRRSWPLGVCTLLATLVFSGMLAFLTGWTHHQEAVAVDLIVYASTAGAALVAGIVSRQWGAIRDQLASERRLTEGERARRLLAEEKTRIARELHDVIAHSMSIISIQAISAPVRHPGTSPALKREFEEIADSSRRALTEMRSLLGILRDSDAPVPRAPAPRLSDIPELVQQSRRSGLSVRLIGGEALADDDLDEAVGLTGYRIAQEALSNVIRHAPGSEAEVRVRRDDDLEIVVSNTASPSSARPAHGEDDVEADGNGLRGMRERAAAVGGTVAHGSAPGGGYEVRLTLPFRPPLAEEASG